MTSSFVDLLEMHNSNVTTAPESHAALLEVVN